MSCPDSWQGEKRTERKGGKKVKCSEVYMEWEMKEAWFFYPQKSPEPAWSSVLPSHHYSNSCNLCSSAPTHPSSPLNHQEGDKRHKEAQLCCLPETMVRPQHPAWRFRIKLSVWFSIYFQVRNFPDSGWRKPWSRFDLGVYATHRRLRKWRMQFLKRTSFLIYFIRPGRVGEDGCHNK